MFQQLDRRQGGVSFVVFERFKKHLSSGMGILHSVND